MALDTLKGISEINGYGILKIASQHMNQLSEQVNMYKQLNLAIEASKRYILVDDIKNTITFKIQQGVVMQNGVNGCQVDQIIEVARLMILGLNRKCESDYNYQAMAGLQHALKSLKERRNERTSRNVQGTEVQ